MNPEKTALVVLDGQNDFLSEGGVLNAPIRAQEADVPLSDAINRWIDAARSRGMLVINTRVVFSPGYPEAGNPAYGLYAAVKETGGFQKGTWGGDTAESLNFEKHDPILDKPGMSAFLNPRFESTLRERRIETLILTGLLTDACVECTMREAYDRGYQVYAASDAMRTLDPDKHRVTVDQSFPLFSRPIALDDL